MYVFKETLPVFHWFIFREAGSYYWGLKLRVFILHTVISSGCCSVEAYDDEFVKKSFYLEIKEILTQFESLLCPSSMLATFAHIILCNPQRSFEVSFINEDRFGNVR